MAREAVNKKCALSPKKSDTSNKNPKPETTLVETEIKFPAVYEILKSADILIADTSASNHTMFCKNGTTNFVAATSNKQGTVGITGEAIQNEGLVDIP